MVFLESYDDGRQPFQFLDQLNCRMVPGTGCLWALEYIYWVYSLVLLVAARLAAAPVSMVVLLTWASAYV